MHLVGLRLVNSVACSKKRGKLLLSFLVGLRYGMRDMFAYFVEIKSCYRGQYYFITNAMNVIFIINVMNVMNAAFHWQDGPCARLLD